MERRIKKTPQEVLVLCREREVKAVNLRFTDFFGRSHQLTVPISQLTDDAFENGFGFDGSGIGQLDSQDESDIILVPLPHSAWIDPFASLSTVVLTCAILDPITREEYARDPRNVAKRAENYLIQTGVADMALLGPQVAFYIFNHVHFDHDNSGSAYSIETLLNNPLTPSGNYAAQQQPLASHVGTFANDTTADLRNEMMQTLIDCGVQVGGHYPKLSLSGQAEIDLRSDSLLAISDTMAVVKYLIRNVARRNGKSATFMPKPMMGDLGSGLHLHLSLWKAGEPLFAGTGYAGLSDVGLHAIGGILKHAAALFAFTNPTTNSYRRLIPGGDAPVTFGYSQRIRSAACRVPMTNPSPKSKRIEFRCPDSSCNPYLALSAVLMAAIDGIQNKIDPGEPMDKAIYDLPPEVAIGLPQAPQSLDAALDALTYDSDFLLRGDVFSEEALTSWISAKRKHEIAPLNSRPHPYEFSMYYDV